MGTSPRVAKIAGKDLKSKKTPKKDRPPIAAALAESKGKTATKKTSSTKKSKK